eukprot:TRINITY_DN1621_c1_g1_i1.p1 TRINITY_DN1621_c1_g1~~TRINITY_DN1621_c1_g1_i1.p1  ORF type:complete len:595 (+),score=121.82 TRINITY_DN1621_c1_g1_i1:99-1787(+)
MKKITALQTNFTTPRKASSLDPGVDPSIPTSAITKKWRTQTMLPEPPILAGSVDLTDKEYVSVGIEQDVFVPLSGRKRATASILRLPPTPPSSIYSSVDRVFPNHDYTVEEQPDQDSAPPDTSLSRSVATMAMTASAQRELDEHPLPPVRTSLFPKAQAWQPAPLGAQPSPLPYNHTTGTDALPTLNPSSIARSTRPRPETGGGQQILMGTPLLIAGTPRTPRSPTATLPPRTPQLQLQQGMLPSSPHLSAADEKFLAKYTRSPGSAATTPKLAGTSRLFTSLQRAGEPAQRASSSTQPDAVQIMVTDLLASTRSTSVPSAGPIGSSAAAAAAPPAELSTLQLGSGTRTGGRSASAGMGRRVVVVPEPTEPTYRSSSAGLTRDTPPPRSALRQPQQFYAQPQPPPTPPQGAHDEVQVQQQQQYQHQHYYQQQQLRFAQQQQQQQQPAAAATGNGTSVGRSPQTPQYQQATQRSPYLNGHSNSQRQLVTVPASTTASSPSVSDTALTPREKLQQRALHKLQQDYGQREVAKTTPYSQYRTSMTIKDLQELVRNQALTAVQHPN